MIRFFTIVLDGMPWIAKHMEEFEKLQTDWRWLIVEGVAENVACTSWCNRIPGRLSTDGTTEYLNAIAKDNRVSVIQKPLWHGKVEMCNTALSYIQSSCLLWQVDADEIWTAPQIEAVHKLFVEHPEKNCAYFWCRYFLGSNIIVANRGGWGNNPSYEWKRVWRFTPGMKFSRHEPPIMAGMPEKPLLHSDTEAVGAVFDHQAYSTLSQVKFKENYYSGSKNPVGSKYIGLSNRWMDLQANRKWPVQLNRYFPFVPDAAMASTV